MRAALAAVADDGDLLALDEIEIGIAIVIDTHGYVSFLVDCQMERIFGRLPAAPKRVKNCSTARLASRAISAAESFSGSPSSSRICTSRPTRPKKVRKAVFGVVEGEQPRLAPGLEQRLQPLADGEAAIVEHDRAEIALARAGMATRRPGSARSRSGWKSRSASSRRSLRGCRAAPPRRASGGRSCRPAPSTPATARWRSAARRGRRTICRAFPWSSSPAAPRRSWSARRPPRPAGAAPRRARPAGARSGATLFQLAFADIDPQPYRTLRFGRMHHRC